MAAPEAHQTRILFDDNSFDDELTRSLFNVLKATLEYPASRCAKARKLVIDMLYFCVASDDDPANFFDIWHVFFDIISYIPPDHEWQLCLGDALDILRQDLDRYIGSDSTLFTPEEKETLSSAEWLPELKMATVVYWNGFASMFLSSVVALSQTLPLTDTNLKIQVPSENLRLIHCYCNIGRTSTHSSPDTRSAATHSLRALASLRSRSRSKSRLRTIASVIP